MITGRLILVRHGETEGNVARRLDTALPGSPLTENGILQARELGERLRWEQPVVLVSSAARRAQQTATEALSTMGLDIEHQVLEGLHEVQAGDLEDRADHESHHRFHGIYSSWHLGLLDQAIPGGESGRDVLDRFVPVIDGLREKYLDNDAQNTIVVVAHGAAIRLVAAQLAMVPPPFALASHLRNTQAIELGALDDGSWHCLRWGSILPPFGVSESAEDPMG